MKNNPICLVVLDGWGVREETAHNGIASAHTPFYNSLMENFSHTTLRASEEYVGLPAGQIGNSEVGHMTIGAGKTIDTDLVRINKAVDSGEFGSNPLFLQLFSHVKKHGSTLHILGLVSPGGIHSHQDHLHAFLKAAKNNAIEKLAIHAFTDGRDVPPQSAAQYLENLELVLKELGIGHIASASGRFYAMDRDNNWDRIKKAEAAIFDCDGKECTNKRPSEVFRELYQKGILDEHAEPMVFLDDTGKSYGIEPHDGVFFFNYRSDRGKQFSQRILERAQTLDLCFATLTEYDKNIPSLVAFPPATIETTLANEISKAGLSQAHIAETEKYPHATYFLNGGRKEPYPNEKHILIESRKDVPTHDLAPEMKAKEITDAAVAQIAQGIDFLFINYANADMVGHTANQPAIKRAVETVDKELERLYEAIEKQGGLMIVTADHGNAELMIDPISGENHTAHTLNKVPAIITRQGLSLHPGTLADIAPTILELMEIEKPAAMTGTSIIDHKN